MRKTERLDQILLRLGYVTQAQIEEAVERQTSQGGRFGSHLVEVGAVSEEQLFDALVEQFRVPTISVDERSIRPELLEVMPVELLAQGTILPVDWNQDVRVLSVAVANPSDEKTIQQVGAAFGAQKVRVSIAPESVLKDLAARLMNGSGTSEGVGDPVRLVAFPELFEPETRKEAAEIALELEESGPKVLMVTAGASQKNFLPPVFKSEGVGLHVISSEAELDGMEEVVFETILVGPKMKAHVESWIEAGSLKAPTGEIVAFSSVSESLLENPLPYNRVVASLRGAVQTMAEFRSAQHGVSAPYALMSNDLEIMSKTVGLPQVVTDGLHVGLHLLMPAAKPQIDPFSAFQRSLELVTRIRFPWPVDAMLAMCHGFYVGRVELEALPDAKDEIALAAQVLALVWYRHNLVTIEAESDEDAMKELRTSLREVAGRLALLEIVEAYLDAIGERGGARSDAAERRVLMVGDERAQSALAPALVRVGCEPDLAPDVQAAQAAVEEKGPSAIIVDHAILGDDVAQFAQVMKLGGEMLFFVLTDSEDPALVLNLLDIGVDDVFGPPHEFDLVAARVNRAILSRALPSGTVEAAPGQFSASFEAFSFLDLAQMLSNGMKTVRVDFRRGDEEAVLYLVNGTPVYAACGDLTGPKAIYHIITWEEEGEFTVSEDHDSPEANIAESTESLLMEGVRLLDESRA